MSKVIATSTERMESDIRNYDAHLAQMQSAFNDAWNAVEELNATWSGPAHDTLVAQFVRDKQIMMMLTLSLKQYRAELQGSKKEYENCENTINSLIKSMKV